MQAVAKRTQLVVIRSSTRTVTAKVPGFSPVRNEWGVDGRHKIAVMPMLTGLDTAPTDSESGQGKLTLEGE